MSDQILPIPKRFTALPSVAEATGGCSPKEIWENEGGQMSATRRRIISTPDGEVPYKVILSHHESADTERTFTSMRAAEAYIRRNTPRPAPRSTFWDRDAPKP